MPTNLFNDPYMNQGGGAQPLPSYGSAVPDSPLAPPGQISPYVGQNFATPASFNRTMSGKGAATQPGAAPTATPTPAATPTPSLSASLQTGDTTTPTAPTTPDLTSATGSTPTPTTPSLSTPSQPSSSGNFFDGYFNSPVRPGSREGPMVPQSAGAYNNPIFNKGGKGGKGSPGTPAAFGT